MTGTGDSFTKLVLALIGILSAAGIIAMITLGGNFRAHEATSAKAHENFTERIGEVKDDLRAMHDEVDGLKERAIRQEIILESIAETVHAPVPPKSSSRR